MTPPSLDAAQRRLVVTALASTAVLALSVGIPATFAPHTFYAHFPFVRHWVNLIPPYNSHLTTDVGGLQLAFGLLFAWAARRPAPELVVPVCLTWSLSQALHLAYHLAHLDGFGVFDAITQTLSLLAVTLVPLIPVVYLRALRQTGAHHDHP
ncbi:MAG: hypothetical protein QOF76_5309 [Solirubrobacteraceae bacterium]|jgi:hypothetical protein|nr:hypothetical protein [Solirubrobacteraceae bacterium]